MATTTEIKFKRGDTYNRTFIHQTSLLVGIDITGYTFYFTVKRLVDNVKDDSSALIQKDITTFTDPTNGKFTLSLTKDETDIPQGEYVYDFQYKKPDGSIHTINENPLCIVEGDVTRRNI